MIPAPLSGPFPIFVRTWNWTTAGAGRHMAKLPSSSSTGCSIAHHSVTPCTKTLKRWKQQWQGHGTVAVIGTRTHVRAWVREDVTDPVHYRPLTPFPHRNILHVIEDTVYGLLLYQAAYPEMKPGLLQYKHRLYFQESPACLASVPRPGAAERQSWTETETGDSFPRSSV